MDTAVILPIANQPGHYTFNCPGCECGHRVNVVPSNGEPSWWFNGDVERPTLAPSVRVRSSNGGVPTVCHSFVLDGQIQFLDDCTHWLAGKTVPLPVI